jgi:hypothetical protein
MAAYIKSTNSNNYDINGFIDPEYVGMVIVITCLCRLEVEILVRDPDPQNSLKNEVTHHGKIYFADHDFV